MPEFLDKGSRLGSLPGSNSASGLLGRNSARGKMDFGPLKMDFGPLKMDFGPLKMGFGPLKMGFGPLKMGFEGERGY